MRNPRRFINPTKNIIRNLNWNSFGIKQEIVHDIKHSSNDISLVELYDDNKELSQCLRNVLR